MTRPQTIERLLRTHFPQLFTRDTGGERNYDPINNFIHDLTALVPVPSREALRNLLHQWHACCRCYDDTHTHENIPAICSCPNCDSKIPSLLAWAGGSVTPRWCKEECPNPWKSDGTKWIRICTGQIMDYQDSFSHHPLFCDRCGTPRPGEAG